MPSQSRKKEDNTVGKVEESEAGSPSSVVEDHEGCVSLDWAPAVVEFLNSLDPAGDWDRDMVEFIWSYWFKEFDIDDVLPVNPGEHLLLTPSDLGLDKRRTLNAWVAAEVVSVEETSSIVRHKEYKSQRIKCRLRDEKIYNLITKKRPEMKGDGGLLVKENFIYEKREGARAEIYLRLKKKLREVDKEKYRAWLEKREIPMSSEEETKAKKRKKNSAAGKNRRRARGESSISSPSRTNSLSSKTVSPSLSPEEKITPSVSPSPADSIETRVRRSSRHTRGGKRSDAELAKLIQDNLLQDNSSYGRYYKLKRLREEGGGPSEPPSTPASPGKPPINVAAPVGGGRLLEVHEAVREAVASVEVIPEVGEEIEPSVTKKKGRASSSKSSGSKRSRSEGSKTESAPVEDPREIAEKKARTFLAQPVVDRDYTSRLETVLPANRVRQRQKAAEGFANAIERGVRSDGKTPVNSFCRNAGGALEAKIFIKSEGITEAGWPRYLKGISHAAKNILDAGGVQQVLERQRITVDQLASNYCTASWLKSMKANDDVVPFDDHWNALHCRLTNEMLRQCKGEISEERQLSATSWALELCRRCYESSIEQRKDPQIDLDLRYYHNIEKVVRRIRGVSRLSSQSLLDLAQTGKITCGQLLEASVEEIQACVR